MDKTRSKHARYSTDFKLQMLLEYYKSGGSKYAISKKYDLNHTLLIRWVREFESKAIPLPEELSELENQVYMAKNKSISRQTQTDVKTEEEKLREEIYRLRKALEYSELRNEALHEVLKIGREQYGVDLLKKVGAKQ